MTHYLAERGITLPLPHSLRWAPALRRPDGTQGPAMVARVNSLDGKVIGVHPTWLDRDDRGRLHRRDRASLGPVGGGSVRLAPAAETLLIGEGIETSLAAMQATAMPAWAALSASAMVAPRLPASVHRDGARAGPGMDLAEVLAGRASAEVRDAAA